MSSINPFSFSTWAAMIQLLGNFAIAGYIGENTNCNNVALSLIVRFVNQNSL
jgi:hypothetical protein